MNSAKHLHQLIEGLEFCIQIIPKHCLMKEGNIMAKAKTKTKAKAKTKVAAKRKAPAKKRTGKKSGLTTMTYTVSDDLAVIVGGKKMTRPEIVKKLWVYIKSRKLQDAKNRRMINPDDKLAKVFGGKKSVDMLKMAGLINKHISK